MCDCDLKAGQGALSTLVCWRHCARHVQHTDGDGASAVGNGLRHAGNLVGVARHTSQPEQPHRDERARATQHHHQAAHRFHCANRQVGVGCHSQQQDVQ